VSLGINDDKYTLRRNYGPEEKIMQSRERVYPPGSFFPLIQGDALAVMTLRSYANNCLQVLEFGINPVSGDPLSPLQQQHLEQLGQDALALADKWAAEAPHLPD
jgi:hypothetical protein